jgi:hypothetical protein
LGHGPHCIKGFLLSGLEGFDLGGHLFVCLLPERLYFCVPEVSVDHYATMAEGIGKRTVHQSFARLFCLLFLLLALAQDLIHSRSFLLEHCTELLIVGFVCGLHRFDSEIEAVYPSIDIPNAGGSVLLGFLELPDVAL